MNNLGVFEENMSAANSRIRDTDVAGTSSELTRNTIALILAAVGAKGMPLVVEISIAFSVLVAMTLFGIFFFRIRERFDSLDLAYLETYRGEHQ